MTSAAAVTQAHTDRSRRPYAGINMPLLALLGPEGGDILDVGCGSGGAAGVIKEQNPSRSIYGVTVSTLEATLARPVMAECWVADLEGSWPRELEQRTFDSVICSHVLEHLKSPARVVTRLAALLRGGGRLLIAVPNVAYWRNRLHMLAGHFEYQDGGVLDETHLRFFTFHTADKYLLKETPELILDSKVVDGHFPLGILRRRYLGLPAHTWIDRAACRLAPNWFGWQVLLRAIKTA